MSKKGSSSEEMGTVKRSRNPAVVLITNGEVLTHKEAHVFVHDLILFVTVQLLEETPAALSLGKLCEDHGYSYEWVSGQEPRLTKDGKSIICKTSNFVPLVVPGLSVILEAVRPLHRYPRNRSCSMLIFRFSIWAKYGTSSGKLWQESWENDKKDKNDLLAAMPFWLEDFTDN